MGSAAIEIAHISKQYRLGAVSSRTMGEDLNRWWHRLRGKEDPYLRIGEANDRSSKGSSDYVWALRDVSFEVPQGEAVAIVGRNGAGKSTLLKILSRVTAPTSGQIRIKGRMASLLEVGTGFHQDLSGRDNIYLNGAILGMTRADIRRRFEEIVAFAGVERYIDTPVKRYSSGMYVRLAFAVAAHLDPDILIVDEVLAVGDSEFQKKCLGKMKDVSGKQGRTVLFVSHNMSAIKTLCTSGVLMEKGQVSLVTSQVDQLIAQYMQGGLQSKNERIFGPKEAESEWIRLHEIAVWPDQKMVSEPILTTDDVHIAVRFEVKQTANHDLTLDMYDLNGVHVCHFGTVCGQLAPGMYQIKGIFPKNILNAQRYIFNLTFGLNQRVVSLAVEQAVSFEVEDNIPTRQNNFAKLPGVIHPVCHWQTNAL